MLVRTRCRARSSVLRRGAHGARSRAFVLGQNLFCRRSTGTLSTTVDYTYVLRYTSLLRARFCSGRRGHFGFFSDGRRAANEFSTTQDSVGAGRVRRLGEVVYQIRRGAFEDKTAAAFNHNRRAGRARRRRFGAGRRVHGFDEFEACALELIDNSRRAALPAGWTLSSFAASSLSARFECCRLAALCDASQTLRFTVSS